MRPPSRTPPEGIRFSPGIPWGLATEPSVPVEAQQTLARHQGAGFLAHDADHLGARLGMSMHRLEQLSHVIHGESHAAHPLMQATAEGVEQSQLGVVQRTGSGMVDLHGAGASDRSMLMPRCRPGHPSGRRS
jgi:hypothetical protein